jgi:PhzF family phenazine biosynthesis protein
MPSKKGDFRMRYFTPTGHEIAFCGHSTVGALFMIAKEKRFGLDKEGTYSFKVETLAGLLAMEITLHKDEEIQVAYETPKIDLRETKITPEEIASACGFHPKLINPSFPIMFEKTNKDLFVAIRSLADLEKADCDPRSLAQFCKHHDIVALCLFCPEAFSEENQIHMRCFAPLVGVAEDPFTGSVLGGLAAMIDRFKILPKSSRLKVEQGHFIKRPGIVEVELNKKREQYHAKVFAEAVHCFSTEITLT